MIQAIPGVALVSGGSGFVGSHVVRRLLRDSFEVHLLCRETSNFWRLQDVLAQTHRHIAPLEDASRLQDVMHKVRPENIFHLAAATVVAGSAAAAEALITVNTLGTVNLVDACGQVDYRALVSTGDSFEYSNGHQALAEASDCRPDSLHGISKLAATLYAQSVASTQGRPVVTIRLFSTYGPGDHPRRLVPLMIAKALRNEPLTLSRPDIKRDWVFVDDVSALYLKVAANAQRLAGGVYNAGSGVATDLETIVALITRLTASASETQWGVFPAPPHDDYPWVADPALTSAMLDWRPAISLEDGLQRTIASLQ